MMMVMMTMTMNGVVGVAYVAVPRMRIVVAVASYRLRSPLYISSWGAYFVFIVH